MEPRSQLENADQVCIRCQKGLIEDDQLNHVGSKFRDKQNKQHPIDTLISYAEKLKIEALISTLKYNIENKVNTYIHLSCRNSLKNKSRKKGTFEDEHLTTTKTACRGFEIENLILQKVVFIVVKYVSSTANIPIVIRLKWVLQKTLAFTITLLNYASFVKMTQNRIPLKDASSGICVFAVIIVKRFQDL